MKNAIIAAVVAAAISSGSAVAATHWINGRTIRPHSLPLNRLAHKPIGAPGPQGPTGPAGPQGPQGPTGTFEPGKIDVQLSRGVTVNAGQTNAITAYCPPGEVALSGGGTADDAALTASVPQTVGGSWTGPPDSWAVRAVNMTQHAVTLQASVVCTGG